MRSAPFHNGYGMMTMQGTRKPVWRAFEALNGAGAVQYAVTGGVMPSGAGSAYRSVPPLKMRLPLASVGVSTVELVMSVL